MLCDDNTERARPATSHGASRDIQAFERIAVATQELDHTGATGVVDCDYKTCIADCGAKHKLCTKVDAATGS